MINSQEEHEANMNAQGEAEAIGHGEREALWQENERLIKMNNNLTAEVARLGNLLLVRDKHMEVLRKVIEIQHENILRMETEEDNRRMAVKNVDEHN